jgi:hypothetical protein
MKKDFTKDFHEITEMTNKIRSVSKLNEAISFADEYDNEQDPMGYGYEDDECADGSCDLSKVRGEEQEEVDKNPEEQMAETPEGAQILNQIREMALKGMVSLCKQPEDVRYQTLKKVFMMIDRAVETKDDEQK